MNRYYYYAMLIVNIIC